VLIKSAEALERMEKVDTLIVDKTGTLTEGKPAVTAVAIAERFRGGRGAAPRRRLEKRSSEHPLADAIVREAEARGLPLAPATDFDQPAGKGVTGTVDGRRL
jgi:Cu+-exporting ATPase